MSIREVPYRFGQLAKRTLDKHAVPTFESADWGHCRHLRQMTMAGVEDVFPELRTQVVGSAEKVLKHRFRVFGIEKDFGDPINWHLDPKTGKQWPLVFWGDIDYRDGQTVGGIKFAWELNRWHHLPLLGMAFQMTQERKYRDEIFAQLASWLESNPYPRGINWISGIEVGIRIVNLVYALKFAGPEFLDRDQQDLLTEFALLSGRHLYRYHSKYSSCANHAIAEALGLFAAGQCFPDLEGAAKWKKCGERVLEREVTRQIYADGSSFEHSVPYLQFVAELFLVYYLLCREYGEPCGDHIPERLQASFEFLSYTVDANGNGPRIGDGDDACLLNLDRARQGALIPLLNTGAVLFDTPHWILEHAEFDMMTFCLLGGDSPIRWKRLKRQAERPSTTARWFADAGLIAIRDEGDILFVGNGGRLGLEPLGGHGHADCLSFWLSVRGRPIVVDPGTYLYHSGGSWRDYFRSTSGHSTIRVDGQDQAPIVADFMFGKSYQTRWTPLEDSGDYLVWSAEHDGYGRLADPVVHRRTIIYRKRRGVFVIEDQLQCQAKHSIDCLIHLHPECLVSTYDHAVNVLCGEAQVVFELDPKWESCQIVSGQEDPVLGWYSPRFNEIQKSPTLVCCSNIEGAVTFTSVIRIET